MATDEDFDSGDLSSAAHAADYLQVDGNQKRLSEQSYNKLSSSSIRLKSPALTSRITSATSKSAFKPVKKQRRQSLESSAVNLQRNDSFGVSNNRGAMTKELLTAQLKSFLVEPSTPSAGHQHRKLPVSPQEGQQDNGVHSLDRQSLRNRRPNSTDSRNLRYDRTSPMRAALKPPFGGSNDTSRVSPSGIPTATQKRSLSNSRIPTPSSLNTSAVMNQNSANHTSQGNQQPSQIPTLSRKNSIGNGGSSTSRIPTLARKSSLPFSHNHEEKKPSNKEQASVSNHENAANINSVSGSHARQTEKPKSAFTNLKPEVQINRPKSSEVDDVSTSVSSNTANEQKKKKESVIYIDSQPKENSPTNTKPITMSQIPVFRRASSSQFEETSAHQCSRNERNPRLKNASESEAGRRQERQGTKTLSSFSSKQINSRRNSHDRQKNESSEENNEENMMNSAPTMRNVSFSPLPTNPNFCGFETKQADVITEAFGIIGKYFPEKRFHMYNLQRSKSLRSKIKPNFFASHSNSFAGTNPYLLHRYNSLLSSQKYSPDSYNLGYMQNGPSISHTYLENAFTRLGSGQFTTLNPHLRSRTPPLNFVYPALRHPNPLVYVQTHPQMSYLPMRNFQINDGF